MADDVNDFKKVSTWRQYYFIGMARARPDAVNVSPEQLRALLSMVGADAALATGAALAPRLIINQKGTTAWILLFFLPFYNDPEGLKNAARGSASLFIPAEAVRSAFHQHVNWPASVLQQFPVDLPSSHLFVLPFLRHASLAAPSPLPQSLRSPDGELEILAVEEFQESDPVDLMRRLSWWRDRLQRQA